MTLAVMKKMKQKANCFETQLKEVVAQPAAKKGIQRGEIIAVTYNKEKSAAQVLEKVKALNQKDIMLLENEKDYKAYQKQHRVSQAPKAVVVIQPSKWSNWKKINDKLLNPKKDSVFVVDTSMEVMYCADREIKISKNGKIKEYKDISFF